MIQELDSRRIAVVREELISEEIQRFNDMETIQKSFHILIEHDQFEFELDETFVRRVIGQEVVLELLEIQQLDEKVEMVEVLMIHVAET